MAIEHDLIRQIRALDDYDLRRLLILTRGLLVSRGEDVPEMPASPVPGKVTYRQEKVRCGRAACTKCPHGPYWYAYWREDGKMRSRYVGRDAPEEERLPGP